jgi:hypothetical protein
MVEIQVSCFLCQSIYQQMPSRDDSVGAWHFYLESPNEMPNLVIAAGCRRQQTLSSLARRKGASMQRQEAALLSVVVSPFCALARMSAATALRIVEMLAVAEPYGRS